MRIVQDKLLASLLLILHSFFNMLDDYNKKPILTFMKKTAVLSTGLTLILLWFTPTVSNGHPLVENFSYTMGMEGGVAILIAFGLSYAATKAFSKKKS